MPKHKPLPTVLRDLLHFRWNVPALAALSACGNGAKFVTLQKQLGISRNSLQRTLQALIEAGFVQRNQGYGHPLRPEYLLTQTGRRLGAECVRLVEQLGSRRRLEVAMRKWSLPAILAIQSTPRFNRVQEKLEGVSPRALAQTLRELQEARWLKRRLVDASPPRTEYALTDAGSRIATLTRRLARAA